MDSLEWTLPVVFLAATAFTFLRLMAASREATLWQAKKEVREAAELEHLRRQREDALIAKSSDVDVV